MDSGKSDRLRLECRCRWCLPEGTTALSVAAATRGRELAVRAAGIGGTMRTCWCRRDRIAWIGYASALT
jgi:hypothetical protein